jgi:site-specific recombinase XerD
MTSSTKDPLLRLVQSYFDDHLRRVRGASRHTLRTYAHALRLFFIFLADRLRRNLAELRVDDVQADAVLAFLEHAESARRNTPATRNCRLAAIRGFAAHLLRHDIARAAQCQRILAIPSKKTRSRPVTYWEPEVVAAILAEPDRATPYGGRDHALLLFLYNTGARVGEAIAVRRQDIQLTRPSHVRLLGKGDKERICPLWPETAVAIARLFDGADDPASVVFRNRRGGPLSRDGVAYLLKAYAHRASDRHPVLRRCRISPHVLRHSCAVALLQAGVDISVIRDYLGHASIATTSRYVTSNLQMKRDVLDAFWKRAGLARGNKAPWRPKPELLRFLSSL